MASADKLSTQVKRKLQEEKQADSLLKLVKEEEQVEDDPPPNPAEDDDDAYMEKRQLIEVLRSAGIPMDEEGRFRGRLMYHHHIVG